MRRSWSTSSWLHIGLCCFLLLPSVLSVCYFPNGAPAKQDVPCSDNTQESVCCGPGYACLSNKICLRTEQVKVADPDNRYARGSCTDKEWRSSACPSFCVRNKGAVGPSWISKCPDTTEDRYCCNDGLPCDCVTRNNTLLFQGEPRVGTTIGATATTISTRSSTFSRSSTSSRSTVTSSRRLSTTAVSSSSPNDPVSSAATSILVPLIPSISLPPAALATSNASSSGSTRRTTKIGVGVGVPLGVMAIAGIGFLIWRNRRQRQRIETLQSQMQPRLSVQDPLTYGYSDAYASTRESANINQLEGSPLGPNELSADTSTPLRSA